MATNSRASKGSLLFRCDPLSSLEERGSGCLSGDLIGLADPENIPLDLGYSYLLGLGLRMGREGD